MTSLNTSLQRNPGVSDVPGHTMTPEETDKLRIHNTFELLDLHELLYGDVCALPINRLFRKTGPRHSVHSFVTCAAQCIINVIYLLSAFVCVLSFRSVYDRLPSRCFSSRSMRPFLIAE